MDKLKIKWGDINARTVITAHSIKADIDCIVAVARGGLIVGTIVSHQLDKELFAVGVRSYDHNMSQLELEMTQNIDSKYIKDKNCLIVDDICDTGATFDFLTSHLKAKGANNIYTMALFSRPKTRSKLDYCGGELVSDEWVVFPWESE